MTMKKHYFNMIEVLLALTVIAIGMTSIMGLFPVGLKASRQAVAENSSANVADQIVTYMRVMGESSAPAYTATFVTSATDLPIYTVLDINTSGDTTTIDLKDSSDVDVQTLSDAFLAEYKTGSFTNYSRVAPGWAIFTKDPSGTPGLRRRVYFITQGPNCTEDGGNRNVDYSAMALVWKETVQIQRLDSTGTDTWGPWPENPLTLDPFYPALNPTLSASYDYSGKINIELSWPLELPYSQRKKRYYQVVINNPSP